LPNIHYPYFSDVEDVFKQYGNALRTGTVVFVGGTFYAHAYKARYPGATVVAIEENPLSVYTQQFAAYQLSKGRSPATIEELLFFDYSASGAPQPIRNAALERRRARHREFLRSDWAHFPPDFVTRVFNDVPAVGARTRSDTAVADHLLDVAATDECRVCLNPWIEQEAAQTALLCEVEQTAPIDSVRTADVSTVALDADVIFLNTVSDYLDATTLSASIDGLASESGAFVETVLLYDRHTPRALDASVPDTITPIETEHAVDFRITGTDERAPTVDPPGERVRLYRPVSGA
jgi:hypothetical protein